MDQEFSNELNALNWDEAAPRLLAFACRWAANVYGWQAGATLPNGMSIEDIAKDAVAAFATGERKLNPRFEVMVQLKGAVRSILWKVYQKSADKFTSVESPEFFDGQLQSALDPAQEAAGNDFCRRLIELMCADDKIEKSAELLSIVKAYADGAEEVEDVAEATGLPVKRIYELRRHLKEAAARVIRIMNRKETAL